MPIEGVIVDWCAPPSGARRDPGWRRGKHEPGMHVERVDERVEAATDERVVHRPDRDQRLAEQLGRQAELAQPHEQVHLADAELDVLAVRRRLPRQRPRRVIENARLLGANTPTRLIQPPRFVETATSGDAVTMRGPSSGRRASAVSASPNALWVLACACVRTSTVIGDLEPGRVRGRPPCSSGPRRYEPLARAQRALRRVRREGRPRVVGIAAEDDAERLDLLFGELGRVVEGSRPRTAAASP